MKTTGLFLFTVFFSAIGFATSTRIEILKDVQSIYEPLAKAQGLEFEIQIDSNNPSASASADVTNKSWIVTLAGGLVNHPHLHADVLRIIICHELGHIVGGAPRRHIPFDWQGSIAPDGLSFHSSEGQADYYATRSCFRLLVQGQNHKSVLASMAVPQKVKQDCEFAHSVSSEASAICQRAAVAGKGFLNLNFVFPISFLTPDLSQTPELLRDQYPERQCRLDTLFAGALCTDSVKEVFDFKNGSQNECSHRLGQRPRCWYR